MMDPSTGKDSESQNVTRSTFHNMEEKGNFPSQTCFNFGKTLR